MVPPRLGLVSFIFFTIVPMLYKIKNTWLILLSNLFSYIFQTIRAYLPLVAGRPQRKKSHKHQNPPNFRGFWVIHIICLTDDLFVVKSLRIRRSLVKFSGVVHDVNKMVKECLRGTKVIIFAL